MFVISFLLFAILVGAIAHRIPWMTPAVVRNALGVAYYNTLTWTGNAYIRLRGLLVTFLWTAFWTVTIYGALFTFAVMLGNPYLTFLILMAGALPAFLTMYALHLLREPMDIASRKLTGWTDWLGKHVPFVFEIPKDMNLANFHTSGDLSGDAIGLIVRLVGTLFYLFANGLWLFVALPLLVVNGLLYVIGSLLEVANELMRRAIMALAGITLWFLLWAVAALVDITLGTSLTHPAIIGAATLAAMAMAVLWVMGEHATAAARLLVTGIMLGLAVVVSSFFGYTPQMAWAYVKAMDGPLVWVWFITLPVVGWWLASLVDAARNPGHGIRGGHGGKPSIIRRTAITAAVLLLTWGWLYAEMDPWTPQRGVKRETKAATVVTGELAAANTREDLAAMNDRFGRAKRVNPVAYRSAVLPPALEINEIRMAYNEAQATADGRTVGVPTLVVDAGKSARIVHIPFLGPLHITAEGMAISQNGGELRSGPNGVPRPASMAGFQLVANQLPYLALVGFTCDETGCDEANPIFIGSGATVCPSQVPRTGRIELVINDGKLPSFFGDNQGGYRIKYEPALTGVCP